jgi:hypothetical protein
MSNPQNFPVPPPEIAATARYLQSKNATVVEVSFGRYSYGASGYDYYFAAADSSKREQGDVFDPVTGELIAAARALTRIARQMESTARKRVKAAEKAKAAQDVERDAKVAVKKPEKPAEAAEPGLWVAVTETPLFAHVAALRRAIHMTKPILPPTGKDKS